MKSLISNRLIIILILLACIFCLIAIIGTNKGDKPETIPTAYDTVSEIPFEALLSKGDAEGLGKYFADQVSLTVPGTEDDLSKQEAVNILKQFFAANPPLSFETVHNGQSPKGIGKFYIGHLKTSKAVFRTNLMIQNNLIQALGFEKEVSH